jgi:hypothetical protein
VNSLFPLTCVWHNVLIVDQTQTLILKGINDQLVETVGKITISVQIGNTIYQENFDVVYTYFPALQDGILGNTFLKKNGGTVNVYNDTLVLGNKIMNDETNKINEIL